MMIDDFKAGLKAFAACLLGLSFSFSTNAQQLVWSSSFENGFPGEWLNFDDGSWSSSGTVPAGRTSAWTIVPSENGVAPPRGNRMYKGWIVGSKSDSHRAYPILHIDTPTPLVNTFMVYLNVDYARMSPTEWVHFGTWGNDSPAWALHTMSVRDRKLVFGHTQPFEGEYIGPQPRPDFPLRRWVRFTTYLHYQGTTGFVQVWQDGVPMLRGQVAQLAQYPGRNLQRAHWGMYASGSMSHGVQYNDAIEVCTLSAPLTNFTTEPLCNGVRPNPPGDVRAQ